MDLPIKKVNGLPMRRLIMIEDLYKQKKSLELSWEQEHLKEGRYTLEMTRIDHAIKEVITQIKLEEAREADLRNKISDSRSEVSIAT